MCSIIGYNAYALNNFKNLVFQVRVRIRKMKNDDKVSNLSWIKIKLKSLLKKVFNINISEIISKN